MTLVRLLLIFLFLILCVYIAFVPMKSSLLILFVPLIFIGFVCVTDVMDYIDYPGLCIFFCISVVRYLLIPALMMLDSSYSIDYAEQAGILLYLYEEIAILVTMGILIRKRYAGLDKKQPLSTSGEQVGLYAVIVVIALGILIFQPDVLQQYNFIWVAVDNYEVVRGRSLITGLGAMIIDWGKLFLPVVISIFLWKRRGNNPNRYYLIVCVLMLFFNLCIFSGSSRNSAIIPAIASLFFILYAYPEKKRITFYWISISILAGVLMLTLLKTTYLGTSFNTVGELNNYLQAAFAGPRNTSISVRAYEQLRENFSFSTRINDIMGNFPGLSSLFDSENRSSTLFNIMYYSGGLSRDQIIPMVGQGLFHLGPVFSVVPSCLFLILMSYFDKKYNSADGLMEVYLYAYEAAICSMGLLTNMSVVLSYFYSMIVPCCFFIYISKKVKIR